MNRQILPDSKQTEGNKNVYERNFIELNFNSHCFQCHKRAFSSIRRWRLLVFRCCFEWFPSATRNGANGCTATDHCCRVAGMIHPLKADFWVFRFPPSLMFTKQSQFVEPQTLQKYFNTYAHEMAAKRLIKLRARIWAKMVSSWLSRRLGRTIWLTSSLGRIFEETENLWFLHSSIKQVFYSGHSALEKNFKICSLVLASRTWLID